MEGNDPKIWPSDLQKPFKNIQPTEKPIVHPRAQVDIVGEPWLTIQGEGPLWGRPAVFIRTAGCNLDCPLCDTDYTSNRKLWSIPQIVDYVLALRKNCLVVITGGEPLRQNLGPLIKQLLICRFQVQIETNGTYWDTIPWDKITTVCSPKSRTLNQSILRYISAYKYVLKAGEINDVDGLPTSVLGNGISPARPHSPEVPIYVSPCDEQNEEKNDLNLRATIQSVFKHNYTLSLQSHKLLGLQ